MFNLTFSFSIFNYWFTQEWKQNAVYERGLSVLTDELAGYGGSRKFYISLLRAFFLCSLIYIIYYPLVIKVQCLSWFREHLINGASFESWNFIESLYIEQFTLWAFTSLRGSLWWDQARQEMGQYNDAVRKFLWFMRSNRSSHARGGSFQISKSWKKLSLCIAWLHNPITGVKFEKRTDWRTGLFQSNLNQPGKLLEYQDYLRIKFIDNIEFQTTWAFVWQLA